MKNEKNVQVIYLGNQHLHPITTHEYAVTVYLNYQLFFWGGVCNSYRYLFLECTTLTSIQKQNQNFLCFLSSFLKKKKSLTKTARFSNVAQVKIDSTNIINFPCKVFYC